MDYIGLEDVLMMGTFFSIAEDLRRVQRTLDEHGRILRRLENYAAGLGVSMPKRDAENYQQSLPNFQKRKKKGLPPQVIAEIIQSQKTNSEEAKTRKVQRRKSADSQSSCKSLAAKHSTAESQEKSVEKENPSKKRRNRRKKLSDKKGSTVSGDDS